MFNNRNEEIYENPLEYNNYIREEEENPFQDNSYLGIDIYGETSVLDMVTESGHITGHINALFGNDDSSSGQLDYELVEDDSHKNENEPNTAENSEKSTDANTEKKPEKKSEKGKIFEITKEKKNAEEPKENTKEPKETKLLEKKREREGTHTKDKFDNILRKIKSKLFEAILKILNKSLEENKKAKNETPNKKGQKQKKGEVKEECFLKLKQSITIDTNISSNKKLLETPLREIFSQEVSEKMKNYSKDGLDYNKNFIEKIKNDEKKAKTNAILDKTFFECMEHFRGTKYYEELSGLEIEYERTIENLKDQYDDDYVNNFIEELNRFEELLNGKKSRKSRKNKNEEKI